MPTEPVLLAIVNKSTPDELLTINGLSDAVPLIPKFANGVTPPIVTLPSVIEELYLATLIISPV